MRNNIIETNHLTKKFGKFTAVKDIDLRIPKGGIYGFLDPNGAGKSTTIRMLLGLVTPTEGMVKVFDKSIDKNRIEILRKVESMVESPSYYISRGHISRGHISRGQISNFYIYSKNLVDYSYIFLKIMRMGQKNKTNLYC